MGVGGQHHTPGALSPGKNRYPLYRRLGGSHGRSGRVRKISIPPGFDPRIVQSLASHCTEYAISAQLLYTHIYKYIYTFSLVTEAVNISH